MIRISRAIIQATRRTVAAPLFAFLVSLSAFGTPAAAADPTTIIETFHDQLIEAMKVSGPTNMQTRFEKLSPVVNQTFHSELMMRQAAGRSAWRNAETSDRKDLVLAFTDWTTSNYASQFADFSGQTFVTDGTRPGPSKGSMLVDTRFTGKGGNVVKFSYLMVDRGDRWGVYDVLVTRGSTQVSQLAKYVSEFKRPAAQGLPTLTAILRKRTADQLAR